MKKIEVGDYISFKAATRDTYRKAKRRVKSIDELGRPLVGYAGWSHFIVNRREILEVFKNGR